MLAKKVCVILAMALTLSGCGTTIKLLQHNTYTPINGVEAVSSVGINFKFDFCRYYEESEESIVSECYPLNKGVAIKKSSKAVVLNIFIDNREYRHAFKVIKSVEILNPRTGKSEVTKKEIYSGDDDVKAFQLHGPIEPGKAVIISAMVYSKSGVPILAAGDAIYYVPKGGEERYRSSFNENSEELTLEDILAKISNDMST